jgi:hypothetical protein
MSFNEARSSERASAANCRIGERAGGHVLFLEPVEVVQEILQLRDRGAFGFTLDLIPQAA